MTNMTNIYSIRRKIYEFKSPNMIMVQIKKKEKNHPYFTDIKMIPNYYILFF